jgi:hypothetical protein
MPKKKSTIIKKLSDIEILESMRDKLYKEFLTKRSKAKVGDILKVIELKNKIFPQKENGAETRFWRMAETARQKRLPKGAPRPMRGDSSAKEAKPNV